MNLMNFRPRLDKLFEQRYKKFGRWILSRFSLVPVYQTDYRELLARLQKAETAAKWFSGTSATDFEKFIQFSLHNYPMYSQLQQDLVALYVQTLHSNSPGFFIEFGASDGVTYSNSYLLETEFGWKGVLAEPARGWHEDLSRNRNCIVETECVWKSSGDRIEFNEVKEGEYSTIDIFSNSDNHAGERRNGSKYLVETISLVDLLDKNNAPREISFLSIDTEGSEFEILSSFDFEKYKFNFVAVEHNFSNSRDQIKSLLQNKGYQRILHDKSEWDDWYIRVCSQTERFISEVKS
jgi:FkbM family methyltransferase